LGIGAGMDCSGMRLFDVAINDKIVLKDLDIWKEAGTNTVLKKIVHTMVRDGRLVISFPHSKSGQAIISAIAVASKKEMAMPANVQTLLTQVMGPARASTWLDIGDKQYSDKEIKFSALPAALFGGGWLQFSGNTVTAPVSFRTNADADVFVGIPEGADRTTGPKDFEFTHAEIETDESGGKKYSVYRKRYSSNSIVQLPPAEKQAMMYPVIIVPVNNMQPAYDLKPVVSYRSNLVVETKQLQKEMINGKDVTVIKTNDAITVDWPVQIGAADMYSITVKYYNPRGQEIKATVQLTGAGGTMMLEEPIGFSFTKAGKWNTVTFNTHTMINAGNYTIKLIFKDAEGLALNGIDIQ